MKRAAVIVHPGKQDDLETFRAAVVKALADQGWAEPLWLETTPEETGAGLAAGAVTSGVDLVLASGGDGTITAVASGVAGSGSPSACCPPARGTCWPATSECRSTSTGP